MNDDPKKPLTISISGNLTIARDEFDQVCREMAAQDIPLRPDLDQAWRDFVGWRVNYDTVLLALAALTMAPYAPWSSDRSLAPGALKRRRLRLSPSAP